MQFCILYVQTKEGMLKRKTTQLKLLQGEGRANPWLSTLLSLHTSEPFANAPLHFYFTLPFHWHTKMCFHLNPWQTACKWQRGNGFQGDSKSNAPRCTGIQRVTPHFCSQAQATQSSIQQASTWTRVYHINSGSKNWGCCCHSLLSVWVIPPCLAILLVCC